MCVNVRICMSAGGRYDHDRSQSLQYPEAPESPLSKKLARPKAFRNPMGEMALLQIHKIKVITGWITSPGPTTDMTGSIACRNLLRTRK